MPDLLEMHYHTKEVSYCCKVSAARSVPYYIDNGYSGIVVTDHYYEGWFNNFIDTNWKQKIDVWLNGYKTAKMAAKQYDFNVILGMEITFRGASNDYLVYGIDEDFLYENKEIYKMTPYDFRELANKNGLFFSQAHPFRYGSSPLMPELLDGIEVYNGNPRHDNCNNLAEAFAKKNKLIMLSGSDFHQTEDACRGGVYFNTCPKNSHDLALALFNEKISLKRTSNM